MPSPLVTIGIPFFNHRTTLLQTVRSVFAQSFSDWELILIDDGSTDGSWALVEQIRDARVRVQTDGTNRGQTFRLNQIARLARGRYIARMDADDVMHPRRLEEQLRLLEHPSSPDLVCSPVIAIDWQSNIVGTLGPARLPSERRAFLDRTHIIHPTVTVKRDWAMRFPYNEAYRYSQDRELWARTAPKSRFATTKEPLLYYRVDNPSAVRNYMQHTKECSRLLKQHVGGDLRRLEYCGLRAKLLAKALLFAAATFVKPGIARTTLQVGSLSSSDATRYQKDFATASGTTVPGLPSNC
jgi:glycosyltransferase involved in cell wall biosynthesis